MPFHLVRQKHGDQRDGLFWAAIALAVGEVLDAFFIDVPAPGLIYAIVLAACAWWLRRRGGRADHNDVGPGRVRAGAAIVIYPHSPHPLRYGGSRSSCCSRLPS